jgi:hypothetical protein
MDPAEISQRRIGIADFQPDAVTLPKPISAGHDLDLECVDFTRHDRLRVVVAVERAVGL